MRLSKLLTSRDNLIADHMGAMTKGHWPGHPWCTPHPFSTRHSKRHCPLLSGTTERYQDLSTLYISHSTCPTIELLPSETQQKLLHIDQSLHSVDFHGPRHSLSSSSTPASNKVHLQSPSSFFFVTVRFRQANLDSIYILPNEP